MSIMDHLKVSGNYGRGSPVKNIFQNTVNKIFINLCSRNFSNHSRIPVHHHHR
jgi:hypothetical protein